MKKYMICILFLHALMLNGCTDNLSSEKEILSFVVDNEVGEAIIISEPPSVSVVVDTSVDLSAISPQIGLSQGAAISPECGQSMDFSAGSVTFCVKAEDNSTKDWEVTVTNQKSDEAEILSFEFSRLQDGETVIEDTLITINLKQGVDLTALEPTIVISANATIEPASGVETDFSQGLVTYTVTAENGDTKEWIVTAQQATVYEMEILSYTVPDQDGASQFNGWKITVEVPASTDFSNVVPTIETTEGTTIEPASGVAVDFTETGYVDYEVYSEIGTSKLWRVYLVEQIIDANNPYIQYMGRIDYSNPLKPRLHSSGAAIKTKFKGTYCQILLEDQHRWSSYYNYIEIIVDDADPVRMKLSDETTLDVVSGLDDGEHTLLIVKDTEADIGYIDFLGFRAEALVEPDALPERKIEFIGNSITCGYGVDDSDLACGAGEWYDNHNAYYAYGPLVARELNAQWMLSSVSGIGLIHSCCDKTFEMPDVYEKVDLSTTGDDWDFDLYKPDIITICLGQNDGIQDSADFVSAYIDFIGTIRSYNPDAEIICLTSPMASDDLFDALTSYLTGVVDYLTSEGDTKIHKLYLSKGMVSGCDYHPNKTQQQTVADELSEFITNNINW